MWNLTQFLYHNKLFVISIFVSVYCAYRDSYSHKRTRSAYVAVTSARSVRRSHYHVYRAISGWHIGTQEEHQVSTTTVTDGHSVAIRWCQLQDQTVCVCILISDDPIVTAHKQSALPWTTRDVSGDIKRRCRLTGDLADPVHCTHGPHSRA